MATSRRAIALSALAFTGGSIITGEVDAQDVRCHRNEWVRQVQVQFASDGDGLPCQVIWQSAAGADRSKLVWRSDVRLDFCTAKARELIHQLIDGGWTCDAQVPAPEERSAPALTVRLEPTGNETDAALPIRPEPQPLEPAPPSAGRTSEEPTRPDGNVLQAALERDVERLDQLAGPSSGGFEATMGRLGDLNGDGIEDAVALLTHHHDSAPPSHHLLAYVFDGETFQPVARLALGKTHAGVTGVELQGIVDGVIELILQVPEPGDPACCPSGRQRASFVLRDQQLVAAGKNRPGA